MSATIIQFNDGFYKIRGEDTSVAGWQFELVDTYRFSHNGGYVTVYGDSVNPPNPGIPHRKIRIKCTSDESYTIVSGEAPQPRAVDRQDITPRERTVAFTAAEPVSTETDEEIIERLRTRFQILDDMTHAVKQGNVRALIVSGPPGVGKSFGVETVLSKAGLFTTLAERKPEYEIVKGAMSALGLYSKLFEYSDSNRVVVFDDCDSVLLDDVSLNILKGALDTSKRRVISWNTDSHLLRREDIPDRFEFFGGVIFITNIKFENVRSKKLQDHLQALESRCHYIDLQMDTEREKILRIKQIVKDGMLESYNFSENDVAELITFIETNKTKFREVSLRTVLKAADLKKSFPHNWESMARVTLMRN